MDIYPIFFIHLLMDTYVASRYWLLQIMLQWKLCIYVSELFSVFFEQTLRRKLGGSYGSSFFNFWGASILSQSTCTSSQSTNGTGGLPFPISSPILAICCFADNNHPDSYKVVFHCNFNLHFLNDEWHWASFHMSWLTVFGRMPVQIICQLLNQLVFVFSWIVVSYFHYISCAIFMIKWTCQLDTFSNAILSFFLLFGHTARHWGIIFSH